MAKLVCHARHERRFRSDHDEIDLVLAAKCKQPLAILGSDGMALADLGDSRVAGCRMQLVAELALSQLPGQGVLPPT
jgi:hypothetical protein